MQYEFDTSIFRTERQNINISLAEHRSKYLKNGNSPVYGKLSAELINNRTGKLFTHLRYVFQASINGGDIPRHIKWADEKIAKIFQDYRLQLVSLECFERLPQEKLRRNMKT